MVPSYYHKREKYQNNVLLKLVYVLYIRASGSKNMSNARTAGPGGQGDRGFFEESFNYHETIKC